MLGLGLGTSKNLANESYSGILDDLGIVSDCKLGFADILLTKTYTGIAYRLYRQSDAAEQDFYFKNDGTLDTASMIAWCAGSNGLVKRRGNQGSEANFAYQNDPTMMPILISGGTVNVDGNLFDGINDYSIVDDYAAIQIISQPLSYYVNYKNIGFNGDIFAKNENNASAQQYGLKINGTPLVYSIMEGGIRHSNVAYINGINKAILDWSSGTVTLKNNANTGSGAYAGSLTNRLNFRIGARHEPGGAGSYFNGNIKSLLIFNSSQYSNYDNFVNAGL